jgi:hypothetical protein
MSEIIEYSLSTAIDVAFDSISELASEMEDQFENAADWAQKSDANRSRLSAGIVLGGVKKPSVPLSIKANRQQFEFAWKTERTRPDRLWNAVNCLEVCILHLSQKSGGDAANLKVELQQTIDSVKDTYFPPMFSKGGRRGRRR